jgi:signal transduction histidine kinase
MSLVQMLRSTADDAQREADAATQRAAATAEAAKRAAQQAENLQRDLDRAQQILKTADEQKEFFANRAEELRQSADTMWGRNDLYQGTTIQTSPIYSTLAQCLTAIEDFKRVRPILVSSVEAAQAALDAFAQESTNS